MGEDAADHGVLAVYVRSLGQLDALMVLDAGAVGSVEKWRAGCLVSWRRLGQGRLWADAASCFWEMRALLGK